jgi:hypothetical protein
MLVPDADRGACEHERGRIDTINIKSAAHSVLISSTSNRHVSEKFIDIENVSIARWSRVYDSLQACSESCMNHAAFVDI